MLPLLNYLNTSIVFSVSSFLVCSILFDLIWKLLFQKVSRKEVHSMGTAHEFYVKKNKIPEK